MSIHAAPSDYVLVSTNPTTTEPVVRSGLRNVRCQREDRFTWLLLVLPQEEHDLLITLGCLVEQGQEPFNVLRT